MNGSKTQSVWQHVPEPDDTLMIALLGDWRTGVRLPSKGDVQAALDDAKAKRVRFDTHELTAWDSSLLVFLSRVIDFCSTSGILVEEEGLPEGVRRLLSLSRAVPSKIDPVGKAEKKSLLYVIGETGISFGHGIKENVDFIGELAIACMRMVRGKAKLRTADIILVIEEAGWRALPIVSLISLLVGLILAFMGAVQLRTFGAQIYVADLVGIGMAREMGAVMTGVIMAGRTGAAFAANIGTMQVNEEIDALKTLGVSPMDFLVLPRIIALVLMMPILCVYAVFMGLIGGMVVGVGVFDIPTVQYLTQTCQALTFTHIGVGVSKSVLFGFIIAFCGCMQGIRCGRSAAAVGEATTSAVVIAIVYIVVADGLLAVMTDMLGI